MCWTLFARLRSFRIRLGGIFYGCRFCERSLIVMFNVNYCDVFNIKTSYYNDVSKSCNIQTYFVHYWLVTNMKIYTMKWVKCCSEYIGIRL